MKAFGRILLSSFLVAVLLASAAFAASPDEARVEAEAQKIFELTMSPFCPGRALKDCPSGGATELKTSIKERLKAGETSEQVIRSLESRYGDNILAAPRVQGFGSLAWLAPPIFLLLGGIIIATWLLRRKGVIEESPPVEDEIDPELRRAIEKELADSE
jgi:cytochrome c-type biogenesis protein CcmH